MTRDSHNNMIQIQKDDAGLLSLCFFIQPYTTTIKQLVFPATIKQQYNTDTNNNIHRETDAKKQLLHKHTKKLPRKRVVQWQTNGTAQRLPCHAFPSSIPVILLLVLRLMTDAQPPGQQKSPETTTYIISSSTFTTHSLIIICIYICYIYNYT